MANIEELAEQQKVIVETIQKAYDKYKKESYARRTKNMVENHLSQLEENWKKFEEKHNEITQLEAKNSNHPYFTTKYYNQAKNLSDKMKLEYHERLRQLAEVKETTETPKDEACIRSQQVRFHTLTKIIRALENKTERNIEATKPSLMEQWSKIQEAHDHILTNSTTVDQQYLDEFDDVAMKYYEIISITETRQTQHNAQSTTDVNNSIKLPTLNIPHFDGDYKKWTSFHDIYLNVIHNNKNLSDAEKMQYLKGNLSGEAAKIIQHLPISEPGYAAAWEIICNRFNNKRVLFATQIELLLNLPKLEDKTARGLKQIHDTTKECLDTITNLGIDTKSWDPLIIHIISKKLDHDTI